MPKVNVYVDGLNLFYGALRDSQFPTPVIDPNVCPIHKPAGW